MIVLAAFAGLRVHEIAKLRGQEVDADNRTIYVVGKGGRGASIPMHRMVVEIAEAMPRRGWWFPARHQFGQRGTGPCCQHAPECRKSWNRRSSRPAAVRAV
jgi:integrase